MLSLILYFKTIKLNFGVLEGIYFYKGRFRVQFAPAKFEYVVEINRAAYFD